VESSDLRVKDSRILKVYASFHHQLVVILYHVFQLADKLRDIVSVVPFLHFLFYLNSDGVLDDRVNRRSAHRSKYGTRSGVVLNNIPH